MPQGPALPEDVTGEELDAEARVELRTLPRDLATKVARHLVMAGRLVDDDPQTAFRHAQAARRLASRVGIVREAAGLAAYHTGEWSEALAELRAARRLRNTEEAYLPILADCERGLGRPERALDLAKSPAARDLDQADRIELKIVESGARRDLGQLDAAVVTLQIPELRDKRLQPWSARLFYAYADALLEAGREEEAGEWFARAAAADRDGETDAAERYAELAGLEIIDVEDDEDQALETDVTVEESPAEAGRAAAGPEEAGTSAQTDVESTTAVEEPDVSDRPEAQDTVGEPSAPGSPGTDEATGTGPADADAPEATGDSGAGTPEASVSEVQGVTDASDAATAEATEVAGEPGPVDASGGEPAERTAPPADEPNTENGVSPSGG
ncbi:hypothetical protein SAMN04489712_1083 [Thermomonospora echinospora]|uniref:Tetratricopeptide repeat-containing protein n=1 Tax=Thermomonospora echinospora TaxID=1992 RepID=A0A1H6BU38_9ACTN|nr:hypothetical protein [Thermomonospora echinospora]SEG64218.1 hypothetical protein SAMN04489712_1083 [Thermomonospora echinospora]